MINKKHIIWFNSEKTFPKTRIDIFQKIYEAALYSLAYNTTINEQTIFNNIDIKHELISEDEPKNKWTITLHTDKECFEFSFEVLAKYSQDENFVSEFTEKLKCNFVFDLKNIIRFHNEYEKEIKVLPNESQN